MASDPSVPTELLELHLELEDAELQAADLEPKEKIDKDKNDPGEKD